MERVVCRRIGWLASAVVLYLCSSSTIYVKGEQSSARVKTFISFPPQETVVSTGESVMFEWELSQKDSHRLKNISFGVGSNEEITKILITATVARGANHSSRFVYNISKEYSKRLRWLGNTGRLAFELVNVTRIDTNRYVMEMAFGTKRKALSDSIGLVVNYPPQIMNRSPSLKQVRLPVGESVDVMCDVMSCPRARVMWSKQGRVCQNDTQKHTLTFRHAQLDDSGIYDCVATNALGSDRYQVLVIVTSCPRTETDQETPKAVLMHKHHRSSTLLSMIAPATVFFVIFSAYFLLRCPARRQRKKNMKAYENSKGTSTNDEQTTNLLAEWSQFNDRGEKI